MYFNILFALWIAQRYETARHEQNLAAWGPSNGPLGLKPRFGFFDEVFRHVFAPKPNRAGHAVWGSAESNAFGPRPEWQERHNHRANAVLNVSKCMDIMTQLYKLNENWHRLSTADIHQYSKCSEYLLHSGRCKQWKHSKWRGSRNAP
jgi:hypothetical protein